MKFHVTQWFSLVTSDNMSTSFVQQPPPMVSDNQQRSTTSEISTGGVIDVGNLGYVHDLRSIERVVLADPGSLSLVFVL